MIDNSSHLLLCCNFSLEILFLSNVVDRGPEIDFGFDKEWSQIHFIKWIWKCHEWKSLPKRQFLFYTTRVQTSPYMCLDFYMHCKRGKEDKLKRSSIGLQEMTKQQKLFECENRCISYLFLVIHGQGRTPGKGPAVRPRGRVRLRPRLKSSWVFLTQSKSM